MYFSLFVLLSFIVCSYLILYVAYVANKLLHYHVGTRRRPTSFLVSGEVRFGVSLFPNAVIREVCSLAFH